MENVDVFAALANPIRRDILMKLRLGPERVNDIAKNFKVGRPAISEHLQILRRANLVREEVRGRERYYHIDPRSLENVETWLNAFARYWRKRLNALEELLDKETK